MKTKQSRHNIIGFVLATLIPLVIILFSMRVWEMDLSVPHEFAGDAILGASLIKSICENGLKGLYFCESLGAPEISALIDSPFLDLNYVFEILLLKNFVQSPTAILYLMYFFSYPLAGIAMYLLLNRLSDRVFIKVFFSVAYAITPYHFSRGLNHLTLSNYYVVPLSILLALVIADEKFRGIIPERYSKSKCKGIMSYIACIVLGFGNVYYAFFGLVCMGMALLTKMIREKRISCLWQEAVMLYGVVLGVGIGLLPKILYTLRQGSNTMAATRGAYESELYALKVIQMILPCNYNRVDFLARVNAHYSTSAININENHVAALGLVATIGFMIACVWVVLRMVKPAEIKDAVFVSRMNLFSLMILTIVLYCVPGGFGTVISYFVLSVIRCFNRASIVIVTIAICICALFLEYLKTKIMLSNYKIYECVLLVFVGVFVLYSEVPVNHKGWQDSLKQRDAILQEFFGEVETSMKEGAVIYELPFRQFPEAGPLVNMLDYELALGYVYTDEFKWSYGAMKGRNTLGESLYIDDGMSKEFVQGIIDAGFSAVYIDTKGFEDGGEAINRFYTETLGLTPIVSEDEWLYLYVLDGGVINGQ